MFSDRAGRCWRCGRHCFRRRNSRRRAACCSGDRASRAVYGAVLYSRGACDYLSQPRADTGRVHLHFPGGVQPAGGGRRRGWDCNGERGPFRRGARRLYERSGAWKLGNHQFRFECQGAGPAGDGEFFGVFGYDSDVHDYGACNPDFRCAPLAAGTARSLLLRRFRRASGDGGAFISIAVCCFAFATILGWSPWRRVVE